MSQQATPTNFRVPNKADEFDNNPTRQSVFMAQYLLLGLFAIFWTYSSLK